MKLYINENMEIIDDASEDTVNTAYEIFDNCDGTVRDFIYECFSYDMYLNEQEILELVEAIYDDFSDGDDYTRSDLTDLIIDAKAYWRGDR